MDKRVDFGDHLSFFCFVISSVKVSYVFFFFGSSSQSSTVGELTVRKWLFKKALKLCVVYSSGVYT